MAYRRFAQFAALVLALAAPAAHAEARHDAASAAEIPARIGLADSVRIFRERGFDLLIAEAQVRGAEGDLRAAGAVPNPALSAGVNRAFNYVPDCPGCSNVGFSVALSDQGAIESTISGKRGLRKDVASHALAAARLQRADAERVLVAAVKTQYVQTAAARERLEFAKQVMDSLEQTVQLERVRFMKVTNQGQLARIELEALKSEQEYARAARDLRQEQVQLALLLGTRGPVPAFEVDREILKRRLPPALLAADKDALFRAAIDARPDLKGADERFAQADANVSLQRRLRVPDVALGVQYSQMGSGQSAIQPPMAGATVTLPLPLFYQQQGEIRRAEADRDAQEATRARTVAQVRSDVEAAWAAMHAEAEILARFDESLLDRAQRARETTDIQYKAGAIPLMDTLDAQRNWVQVNAEYQAELVAYWTAAFQLEQAVGKELVP